MKYDNGIIIIKQILDSYNDYEILPKNSDYFILRLLDDLKYNRKITKQNLEHFKEAFPELFED